MHLTEPVRAAALRDTLQRALGGTARAPEEVAVPTRTPPLRLLPAEDDVVDARLRDTPGRLAQLQAGDRAGVAAAAHAMRSGSAALGATAPAAACAQVEEAVRGEQPVDLASAAAGLEDEAARAAEGLRALRDAE